MVRSTSTAGVVDVDLVTLGYGDDGDARLPIAQWLKARPDVSDAATIVARLAVARRLPTRRPARSRRTVASPRAVPCDVTTALDSGCTAEAAPAAQVPVSPARAEAGVLGWRGGAVALVAGGAALTIGLAVQLGVSMTGTAAQAAELGEVVVSSHPSGASVLLDGEPQGSTPLVLRLATGRYRLEIAGTGGAVQPVAAEVVAGRSVSHHVELLAAATPPEASVLIVDTGDPAAQLSIDGRPAGATTLASTRVTPGQHTVRVRYEGGVAVERQVIVPAGETVSLVLDQPKGPPSPPRGAIAGWVSVQAPFQVEVFEHDQLVGSSDAGRILLENGPHTLELVNASLGYRASVATRVAAGKVAEVVVETPRAPVAINAQPWAQVIVDGRAHGDTPIANLMLPVGEHRVVLRHPELGEQVQVITVRAAGINRVSVDLRR